MTTYTVTYGPRGQEPQHATVHNVAEVHVAPQFRSATFHDADGELIGSISDVQVVARAKGVDAKQAAHDRLTAIPTPEGVRPPDRAGSTVIVKTEYRLDIASVMVPEAYREALRSAQRQSAKKGLTVTHVRPVRAGMDGNDYVWVEWEGVAS